MTESNPRDRDTAVSIITGFLGSGKTTLLRHLLPDPVMKGAVVIVNEVGEIGLDQQIMDASDCYGHMCFAGAGTPTRTALRSWR